MEQSPPTDISFTAAVEGRVIKRGGTMKKLASLLGRSFLLVAVVYFVTITNSAIIFEIEGKYDAVDSFWWAFTAATTTGYGDIYPVTKTGRAVALFLMHFGPDFAFPHDDRIMSAKLIVDSDAFTHGEQEQKADIAAIRKMVAPTTEAGVDAAALLEADMRPTFTMRSRAVASNAWMSTGSELP
jgi:hypothetical protein